MPRSYMYLRAVRARIKREGKGGGEEAEYKERMKKIEEGGKKNEKNEKEKEKNKQRRMKKKTKNVNENEK